MAFPFLSYCTLVTLQVGTALQATIFFTLAGLALVGNIFDTYRNPQLGNFMWLLPTFFVIVYVILMLITGGIMFYAAYEESMKICTYAMIALGVTLIFWIVMSCLSFSNTKSIVQYVCTGPPLNLRCGESFWILRLNYRDNVLTSTLVTEEPGSIGIRVEPNSTFTQNSTSTSTEHNESTPESTLDSTPDSSTISTSSSLPSVDREKRNNPFKSDDQQLESDNFPRSQSTREIYEPTLPDYGVLHELDYSKIFNKYDVEEEEYFQKVDFTNGAYLFGVPLIGAIVLFIANLLHFVFTLLILWSYQMQLYYTDFED